MKKIIAFSVVFILLLSFIYSGSAVKFSRDVSEVDNRKVPLFNQILNSLNPLTMVGGQTCSTFVDKSINLESTQNYVCPADLEGGCAIDVWVFAEKWNGKTYWDEVKLDPGESQRFYSYSGNWKLLDVYYCDINCDCSDWDYKSCGGGYCNSDQMYMTRDCNSGCDLSETNCIVKQECLGPTCEDEAPCDSYGRGNSCVASNKYVTCQDTDSDTCLESDYTQCSYNEVCENDQCVQKEPEPEPRPLVNIIKTIIEILTPPY